MLCCFEVFVVDLFGLLLEIFFGNKWIFIVEDICIRWVELFVFLFVISEECVKILVNEVYLCYGMFRRFISDNGV